MRELPDVDLRRTYDAIVVGSGAAGGMAAHVLTSHGLDVLMLEAGRQLDIEEELRSMEWPYEHARRGDMPATYTALGWNEYTFRKPPYAAGSAFDKVFSYMQEWSGSDYRKNLVVDEKDHPYTGTPFAWVRSRCLGGKTNHWGRLALRLSARDFEGPKHDGYGDAWPLGYDDLAPYYDRVDRLLGISGHAEGRAEMPDGVFQRAIRLTDAELLLRKTAARMDRVVTPFRAGVTTDGLAHNRYRSRCHGRGACNRRGGGCDIHAAFDSPTGLIWPAFDTGKLALRTNATVHEVQIDRDSGRARGVGFIDTETRKSHEARAKVVVLAASTLESTRLLLASRSRDGGVLANSSGQLGKNFCEHLMGPSIVGLVPSLVGKKRTLDDGRPGGFYIPRFRNLGDRSDVAGKFLRGYGFEGWAGMTMRPASIGATRGFGAGYKQRVRDTAGAYIGMGGFGEVLARPDNYVELDPHVKDRWGIPAMRFHIRFGDNERKMAADMAATAEELFRAAGIEVVEQASDLLTEGWSIHELGTARMGRDPKRSVLNAWQQSHDVANLFVVDGAGFPSAGSANPTWTIMALAWRSCDRLADELKRGNL